MPEVPSDLFDPLTALGDLADELEKVVAREGRDWFRLLDVCGARLEDREEWCGLEARHPGGHAPPEDERQTALLADLVQRRNDVAAVAHRIAGIRGSLRDSFDVLAEALTRSFPYDEENRVTLYVPDEGPWGPVPPVEPRWGGKRTEWDTEALRSDVRRAILDTAGTVSPAAVLDEVEKVVSITGSSVKAGRKNAKDPVGLRGLGLDPDDYSTQTKAPPTITFAD